MICSYQFEKSTYYRRTVDSLKTLYPTGVRDTVIATVDLGSDKGRVKYYQRVRDNLKDGGFICDCKE